MVASRFIYLSRFVCDGEVDKEAFMPDPKTRPLETSVIMHGDEGPDWGTGITIGRKRKTPMELVGVADTSDVDVQHVGLYIEPQPSTISKNHANIKGWDEEEKLKRLLQAAHLAATCKFFECRRSYDK